MPLPVGAGAMPACRRLIGASKESLNPKRPHAFR